MSYFALKVMCQGEVHPEKMRWGLSYDSHGSFHKLLLQWHHEDVHVCINLHMP
jgi:hypothetical protein